MANILRYLGIGEEPAYGTETVAVQHLDINSSSLDTPKNPDTIIPSGMGRSVNRKKASFYSPSGGAEWVIDIQTIARPLKWVLGGYTYTANGGRYKYGDWEDASNGDASTIKTGEAVEAGDGTITLTAVSTGQFGNGTYIRIGDENDPYLEFCTCTSADAGTDVVTLTGTTKYAHPAGTPVVEVTAKPTETQLHLHEIYGSNNTELDSFTARVGKDVFEHVFLGCVLGGLTLKVAGDLAIASATIQAQKDRAATLKTPAELILSTGYPIAFYEVTATLDGTDVSAKVYDVEIDIKNALNTKAGRTIGSRYPRRIPAGDRSTTGKASMLFEDTAMLQKFWGGSTAPGSGGSDEFDLVLNFRTGDGVMEVYFPKCYINDAGQTAKGRDMMNQDIGIQTLLDESVLLNDGITSVATEILVKIWNEQTTLAA